MKKICLLLALVMALGMIPFMGISEASHTEGAWGYHPNCAACGKEMATWGQCTGCFGWCACYTGYCSASMVPADQCTKHDGNCPLLVIAGAAPAQEEAAPAAEEAPVPAAEYASKEDVINSCRVFMLDELHYVTGCETEEKDGLKYYKITFEDGIISHGSDSDGGDFFYNGGMLSDFEADLDGDGVNEYVLVCWYEAYDMYDQPYIYIRIYEPVDGGYNRVANLPVCGSRYSEVEIWLANGADGTYIVTDTINRGDGATCWIRSMIYKYDGQKVTMAKAVGVDNYSGGVVIGANESFTDVFNYLYSSYNDPNDRTELPVEFFGSYSDQPNGSNFAGLSAIYGEYGVQVMYDDYDVDFLGQRKVFHFCGRHDGNMSNCDLAYGVLSSVEHATGAVPAAQPQGNLDFFGTGTVIDEQPQDEQNPADDEYFIADSGERLLTREELSVYTKEELGFIRNEILARYGYPFKKEKYRNHFESTSWYVRNEGFVYSMLNEIEMKNVELIKSME